MKYKYARNKNEIVTILHDYQVQQIVVSSHGWLFFRQLTHHCMQSMKKTFAFQLYRQTEKMFVCSNRSRLIILTLSLNKFRKYPDKQREERKK